MSATAANEKNEKILGKFMLAFEMPLLKAIKCGDFTRKHNYVPRSSDIIVTGPMKSGTTWVQHILHQLRSGGNMDFKDIFEVTWWLPYFFMDNPAFDYTQDQPYEPRIIKCHDPYMYMPKKKGMKYIFICRETYDTCWSLMRFMNGLYGFDGEDAISEKLIQFQITSLTYKVIGAYRITSSWWPHRNDPNVLWLHYEDLKADLETCIRKIAKFAEIPVSEATLEKVIEQSGFQFMSEHKDKFKGTKDTLGQVLKIEDYNPQIGVVRADGGLKGQGQKQCSDSIKKLLNKKWEEDLKPVVGCDNYDELYAKGSCLRVKKTINELGG